MDVQLIFASIGLVTCLTGLGVMTRKLFNAGERIEKNRQTLQNLTESEHMEVHEAIEKAKKLAQAEKNGRISMPAFLSGTTARGSTIARHALKSKKRTLVDQIKKDQDKDYPVMIKNFYMSPINFFGWTQLATDMEAQNFFLADPEKNDLKSTIKVYPSLESHSDLERQYRDVQPKSLGITAMKTGFLSSFQFWGAQYFRMWEVVYEGDRLTLFGTLTYDTNTDQASFDETVSMMASQCKDAISSKLNWDFAKDCFKVAGITIVSLILLFGVTTSAMAVQKRLR